MCTFSLGLLGVQFLRQCSRGFGQSVGLGFNVRLVITLQGFFQISNGFFNCGFFFGSGLIASFFQRFLGRVDHAVSGVAHLNQLFELFVRFSVGFRIGYHLFDFVIAQTGRGLDHDRLFFASCLIFSADVQDAVGIDVERHFNLWHTAWCWWNIRQIETTQRLVLCRLLTLALNHVNGYRRLVVVGG